MSCWRAFRISLIALASLGAVVSAASAGEPAAAEARAPDLDTLLKAFRGMPGLEASFVEDKHMALLAAPLKSEGKLYFMRPGYLARHVEKPRASKVVITPEALRIDDGEGRKRIDLRGRKDVRLFVESFVRVLAGDREALETIYTMAFEPAETGAGWTLTLTPKGPPLSQLVKRMTIEGEGLAVRVIRVDEASGDRTVTRIGDVDPKRRFSPREQRKLFGVEPK